MSDAAALPGSPEAQSCRAGHPRAVNVLAPNASPMTLDGTNTWIVCGAGLRTRRRHRPGPAGRGPPEGRHRHR